MSSLVCQSLIEPAPLALWRVPLSLLALVYSALTAVLETTLSSVDATEVGGLRIVYVSRRKKAVQS